MKITSKPQNPYLYKICELKRVYVYGKKKKKKQQEFQVAEVVQKALTM